MRERANVLKRQLYFSLHGGIQPLLTCLVTKLILVFQLPTNFLLKRVTFQKFVHCFQTNIILTAAGLTRSLM